MGAGFGPPRFWVLGMEDDAPVTVKDAEQWGRFDYRLGKLERDVTRLATSFSSVNNSLERIERSQAHLDHILETRGRTNWGVVATLAGAVAALLVFYTSMVTNPIAHDVTEAKAAWQRELALVRETYEIRLAGIENDLDRVRGNTLDRYSRTDHNNFTRELNDRLRDIENGLRQSRND